MNWEVIKPTFYQGLEVMLYGLLGVFAVLILFYIVVTLLGRIPEKNQESE
ncbi:MAG: OadG family protein [Clostridiaceae bacterium]|jgi:Na+-transporting methylmalonyl-CoA/oxaloacetate decarboxylase gamma subunit|nr:OadG family protein [Clostridiaceae bacterium]